jgi:hypothetical protein
MKVWYMPSWNGDLRLEPLSSDPKRTALSIIDPTDAEKIALGAIGATLLDKGWLKEPILDLLSGESYRESQKVEVVLDGPLEEVGPVVIAALKPGPAVLTAVILRGGKVEIVEHRDPGKAGIKETSKELAAVAKQPAEAAATVKRPTPCCPDCYVDAIKPATQTLLAFLSPEQHETWSRERYIVCRGGLSGHRYILAHRSSPMAARNTRICFDADDRSILHFHDQTVPPEEEVLSAMLILQHREDWLRNEATCLGGGLRRVFKNPFGDIMDGVADSNLTRTIGLLAKSLTPGP